MFSQLHIHTHFSNLDGIGKSEQYAERAYKLGHKSLAITDHGKMTGLFYHQQACKKYGIKPILGVEAYINNNLVEYNEKEKRIRGKNSHIILLARNEVGFKNLLKLNYLSMSDDSHFYYTNRITEDELFEYSEGIIVGTACMQSRWGQLIRAGKIDEAEELFQKYEHHFGENFYAEVQLNELTSQIDEAEEGQKTVNDYMIQFAQKYNVPVVVTGDVHYLESGEDQLQTLSIAIRDKATIDNLNFEIESKHLYYHDEEDYIEFNEKFGYGYSNDKIIEWANNAAYIGSLCEYEIPERRKMYIPQISENDDEALIRKATTKLKEKFNGNIPEEYNKRLKKELEVMIRKGFSSYILLLEDIIKYVIDNGHTVGPSRGCFTENNLVKMKDRTYKKIKDVKEGDYVIAGTGASRKCLEKYEYDIEEEIIELELENGKNIECTLDHEILVLPKKTIEYLDAVWIKAKDLKEGDKIIEV